MADKLVLMKYMLPLLLLFAACQQPATTPAPCPSPNPTNYSTLAVLYHQFAAEYRALCYQTYNTAAVQLQNKLQAHPAKPAIILDLDETVVDNSYYNAWLIGKGLSYTKDTWKQWTAQQKATAVPGSLAFLKLADSLGVTIFYVSNRGVDEQAATVANMEALGYPQLDSTHFYLKTTTSGKEERRQAIYEQGFDVLLYFGDNLNDFDAGFEKGTPDSRFVLTDSLQHRFGVDYFVTPNAMYGEWEVSLYNYNYALSPEERDSIRMSVLKGF